jgi:hypothetical protein
VPDTTSTDPLDLTADDEAMLAESAEEVQETAKKSFSLADRLQGAKLATAKVLVFTDAEPVAAWQDKEREVVVSTAALQAAVGASEPDQQDIADLEAALSEVEAERDEARKAAFAGALAIHMRAVPQVALEAAQRDARKRFADDSGQIPEKSRDDFFERQNEILLGQCVTRVVDAEGNEYDFTRATLHKMLRDALPVPQFSRVMEAFNRLMFNDSLARAATSDPGF